MRRFTLFPPRAFGAQRAPAAQRQCEREKEYQCLNDFARVVNFAGGFGTPFCAAANNELDVSAGIPAAFPEADLAAVTVAATPHYAEFLGTGASVPNKYANVAGLLIRLGGDFALLDCGEATLQQLSFSQAGSLA